jgi:hypothetical protein
MHASSNVIVLLQHKKKSQTPLAEYIASQIFLQKGSF